MIVGENVRARISPKHTWVYRTKGQQTIIAFNINIQIGKQVLCLNTYYYIKNWDVVFFILLELFILSKFDYTVFSIGMLLSSAALIIINIVS